MINFKQVSPILLFIVSLIVSSLLDTILKILRVITMENISSTWLITGLILLVHLLHLIIAFYCAFRIKEENYKLFVFLIIFNTFDSLAFIGTCVQEVSALV